MPINKYMLAALKALSYPDLDVKNNYEIVRKAESLRRPDLLKGFYTAWDHTVRSDGLEVPVRIFSPDNGPLGRPVLLFFHGGGWVTGNIDNYSRVCATMAKKTNHMVVSVDYRLAPEHRFPAGLLDCYEAARELFLDPRLFCVNSDDITLIGDSAGGNLAAAVSLMARDRGEFFPRRQILIYPATYGDHTPDSPFESVRTNGSDYLLTAKRVQDYIEMYCASPEDLQNPYLAPLLAKDLSRQPDTLVITAEYDPLRDEGEAYAKRLGEAGNRVELRRIPDALHGFFSLPPRFAQVARCYDIIGRFLNGGATR